MHRQTSASAYSTVVQFNYHSCRLLNSSHRVCLFCVAKALRLLNLKGRKEPVSNGQKPFESDKSLCQQFFFFLPGSERPAFRAVSPFLRGEPGFNGTTLPLHLPGCIIQATAACLPARHCHPLTVPADRISSSPEI